jgi:hypothetical protein
MSVGRATFACAIVIALLGCSGNGSTISSSSTLASSAGHKVVQSGKQWAIFPLPNGGSFPEVMTNGPDGNVWFTESNSIDQANVATGVITRFLLSAPNIAPTAIISGADGNLWFCEGSVAKIDKITTGGVDTSYPLPQFCTALAATSDGDIWANGGNDIQRITGGGVVSEFPIPSNGTALKLATGSDGNVWFTAQQPCPQNCYEHHPYGRITASGAIKMYNYGDARFGFTGDMVLGGDGALYAVIGRFGPLARIAPDGSLTFVQGPNGYEATILVAGHPGDFFELGRNADIFEGGPSISPHFVARPPNGDVGRDMVYASDGNLWITQPNLNSIAVYLRHRIKPVPVSISVTVGNSEQLSIHEQDYSGGWQVTSTDPTIATVAKISSTQYNVTGVKAGSCSILITDTKNNQLAVPVTVN